jgi:hypothetical protein
MTGAEAEFDAAAGDVVEGTHAASQQHRMVQVAVQDQRTESDAGGAFGKVGEQRKRLPLVTDMVSDGNDIEAGRLRCDCLLSDGVQVALADLQGYAKRSHGVVVKGLPRC